MTKPIIAIKARAPRALAMLLAVLALCHAAAANPWRALYAGQLGSEYVVVELALLDANTAHARVLLNDRRQVLVGVGSVQDADALEIDLAVDASHFTPSFALLYLALGSDDELGGDVIGHLSGRLNPTWQDDGANLDLTLTLPDGARAATLPRVAQYAYLALQEGRLEASSAWPRFAAQPLRAVAGSLEAAAYDQIASFIGEGRSAVDEDYLGWGWTSDDYVDVAGAAGPYISLLVSADTYTGGAHPNSYYGSQLYELRGGGATRLDLADLFSKGVDWQTPVTSWLTADLLAQEAMWIQEGSVVTVDDLTTFALGPTGLTFVFDPYAMGPYVQGAFVATVPYSELVALAPEDGAVAAFAGGVPSSAFR